MYRVIESVGNRYLVGIKEFFRLEEAKLSREYNSSLIEIYEVDKDGKETFVWSENNDPFNYGGSHGSK
jgi:hypothetical protein